MRIFELSAQTVCRRANSGRILAAYGGIFVAGPLAWALIVDGLKPDRWDITGALICLAGVAVIMYALRPT